MANDIKKEGTDSVNANSIEKIASACNININLIFIQLHFKALLQAEKKSKDITILNSIVDGKDEKSAKFYGAGHHVIAAISRKSEDITADEALPVLQEYVSWFSGPDIKLSKDLLIMIDQSDEVSTLKNDNNNNADTNNYNNSDLKNESIYVPSFSLYLITEEGTDNNNTKDNIEDNVNKSSENNDAANKKPTEEKSKGWYITFKLNIKGLKEHPLADALKSFGKKMLEGFGISSFDWKSGATGLALTVGDVLDSLDAVFGKIAPDELMTKFNENMKKKLPNGEYRSEIWDTKTVRQHLKKQLDNKSISKLKNAELALCVRVDKRDKSYKLYNSLLIADVVTSSIQGLFKKFKNKVTKDNVIMVNNYSDNKRDAEDKKYNVDKKTGSVADSIIVHKYGKLLTEANEKNLTPDQLLKELLTIVKADLKDYNAEAIVDTSDRIVDMLKKAGLNEPDLFESLIKNKYSFLIKTKLKLNESYNSEYKLLNYIFEKKVEKNDVLEDIKKAFKNFLLKFKSNILGNIKQDAIDNVVGYVSDKKVKESIVLNKTLSFMHMIYEDINDDTISSMLIEAKTGGKISLKDIIDFIEKKGAENILNTKDKYKDELDFVYKNSKFLATYKGKYKKEVLKCLDSIYNAEDNESMILAANDVLSTYKNGEGKGSAIILHAIYETLKSLKIEDKKADDPEKEDPPKKDEDPKEIPEEIEKFLIGFMDKDPNSDEGDDPEYKSVERGGSVTPPKPKYETDKHEFVGWRDNNGNIGDFDDIQEPKTYMAEYKGIEPYKFPVTFFDIDFAEGSTPEIETQWIEKGKSATSPSEPNHEDEGWKFKGWSDKFDKIEEPKNIIAEYDKIIKIIAKAPEDPTKPDNVKPIKDGEFTYNPEKSLEEQLPKPPDFKDKGFDFDKWDPDPSEIKDPKEDIEIVAKYKEHDDSLVVYYAIPDENGLLTDVDMKVKRTELDFYIVPMKGLSYNTRKALKEGK